MQVPGAYGIIRIAVLISGAIFTGEKCKIEINRNKFSTNPRNFVKNPPDPKLAKRWEGNGSVARGHIENWFDCIKSRAKPNADVEIGHRTVTVGHLINIAREVGRNLRWVSSGRTNHRRCRSRCHVGSAST